MLTIVRLERFHDDRESSEPARNSQAKTSRAPGRTAVTYALLDNLDPRYVLAEWWNTSGQAVDLVEV
jgi:hypothetical protein